MKKLEYLGFTNKLCECEYGISTINGENILIIKQTLNSKTSITNVIETIVSNILAKDLFGKNPENIRIFEHYPATLDNPQVWQEVKFKKTYEMYPDMSFIDKLKQLLLVQGKERYWAVDDPDWSSVSDRKLMSQLIQL